MDRATFLALSLKVVPVQVEGFDQPVFIRPMRESDRILFVQELNEHEDDGVGNVVRVIAKTLCDEQGKLLFDSTQEDYDAIANIGYEVFEAVAEQAMRLNGFSSDDAKKNSTKTPDSPSSSDSQTTTTNQ